MRYGLSFALAASLAFASQASASSLTFDFDSTLEAVFSSPAGTFSDGPGATWGPGDWFGEIDNSLNVPFAVVDESAGSFPGDTAGVIPESKTDSYFAATDTVNGANSAGALTATWTFDITGLAGPLSFSVDMGAMGDFEGSDDFDWTFSVDGAPAAPLFTIAEDGAGSATYTLAGGGTTTLDDPLLVDGVVLLNGLTTFTSSAAIPAGSSLEIALTVSTDGGSEAYAFDNLVVTAIPEPGAALLVLMGLTFAGAAGMRSKLG